MTINRQYSKLVLGAISLLCLTTACSDPTDAWDEINAVIPGNYSYTVTQTEKVNNNTSTGVSTIDASGMNYTIAFSDPDGKDCGHLDFEANSGLTTLTGDYQALGTSTLQIDGTKVSGTVSLSQNALNSLSVKVGGSNLVSFAKGAGVPEFTRPANNDCVKQFLLSKSSANNGLYTYQLSLGAKGISAEQGMIDTYKGTGDYVILKFNTDKETLQPGTYKATSFEAPANETFSVGKLIETEWFNYMDGSQFYSLNNDTQTKALTITGGEINVALIDESQENYKVDGYLILEDNSVFSISYTGNIAPKKTPTRYTYTDEVSAVTSMDWTTFEQTVIPGIEQHIIVVSDAQQNEIARFTFVTESGSSNYSGTYDVVESAAEKGKMNNGYDLSAYGMGIGGSYWFDGGERMMLDPGASVTITDDAVRTLTFSGDGFSITAYPEGSVLGGDIVCLISDEISDVYSPSFELIAGVKTHSLSLKNGEETVAVFAVILPEGVSEIEGSYDCVENASEAYKMVNGFDLSMFGMGLGGSYWYQDGSAVMINAGAKLTITKEADGTYSFTGNDFEFKGKF